VRRAKGRRLIGGAVRRARVRRKIGRALHELKTGALHSGGSGKRVTNPRQAIAIGLSEARQEGINIPRPSIGKRIKRGLQSFGAHA